MTAFGLLSLTAADNKRIRFSSTSTHLCSSASNGLPNLLHDEPKAESSLRRAVDVC